MTIDMLKVRRESMRWYIMAALNNARPVGALDVIVLSVIRELYADSTANELHQQLDYLEQRNLVKIDKQPNGNWHSCLTCLGVDVVEYTVDCHAGIARPVKYWNG